MIGWHQEEGIPVVVRIRDAILVFSIFAISSTYWPQSGRRKSVLNLKLELPGLQGSQYPQGQEQERQEQECLENPGEEIAFTPSRTHSRSRSPKCLKTETDRLKVLLWIATK
jgi:hypothetical protein